jgi:hypothetical protein
MRAAVTVLEEMVASGAVPQLGTITALVNGCQRAKAHELAFQVRRVIFSIGVRRSTTAS